MTPADPREARLPKWAQGELASLRDRLRRVKEDFEEFADTATTDDVVAVANPNAAHPRPAARQGETVRFLLDGVDGFRWIDVTVHDREIEVLAATGLVITPHVTNRLTLSLNRD